MMASFSSPCLSKQQLISILFTITMFSHVSGRGCYKSIFSFGDSLADTGNLVILSSQAKKPDSAFPPYGETYFHGPTGRFSDGRLVIDFFAQTFGLPLIPPYFGAGNGSNQKFLKGVNFAVAGATALDNSFLAQKGINPDTNVSLGVQVGLFKKLLPSLCPSPSECNELLKNSLILMGEIGGNDFNGAFLHGITTEVIQGLVPDVINVISCAIQELIKLGAVTFLVPGNLPIGCLPIYLTRFQTSNKQDYDRSTGCLTWLNEFSEYYNEMLKKELNKIRKLHPRANVVYADYYQAAIPLYRSPRRFRFNSTLIACCGGGGPYNYNFLLACGRPGTKSCNDPSSYASWDGVHFTEATYRLISKAILDGSRTIPQLKIPCA